MPAKHRFTAVLFWAGLAAWAAVSVVSVVKAQSPVRLIFWAGASLSFLAAFVLAQLSIGRVRAMWAVQSLAVIGMVASLCNGYEGFLLALIAAQLGWRERREIGFGWIMAQTAGMAVGIAFEWTLRSALLLTPPYLAFQVLMFAVTRLLVQELRSREELERAHERLLGLQQQLLRQSRMDERLRMTQDLHDVLGHRLTALSLNLEAALHSREESPSLLTTAQSLVRGLLSDIKSLVAAYKDDETLDLAAELRSLARDLPTPRIDLECPNDIVLTDPRAGRALLRCAQEFVTNSIRHGAATQVWIRIESQDNAVRLVAQDNGSGGEHFKDGFGLAGMRRRMHELGGALDVGVGASGHFEVIAIVPIRECAA